MLPQSLTVPARRSVPVQTHLFAILESLHLEALTFEGGGVTVLASTDEPAAHCPGQTEGQVTRLKLIKRPMHGRANFTLLRRRVLRAA